MRIASVSVLYIAVIASLWVHFLSPIVAQGGYDEPGHVGPRLELFDPSPFYDATGFGIQAEEEWDTPKEEIPYTYLWENRLGQTAQQMAAVISLLESEGLTSIDIELFLSDWEYLNSFERRRKIHQ